MTTNGDQAAISGVEKVNQLVRAGCVGILLVGFVLAFLWGVFDGHKVVVSSDAFISVLTVALTWWFKSRDEQQRRADLTPAPGTTTTTTTPGDAAKPTGGG
jgi:hypothetical protein